VFILLPASKGKTTVRRGKRYHAADLSFPTLGTTREAVLDALIEVSGRPDATTILAEPPGVADAIAANVHLRETPTATVESLYAGVMYDAIGLADLDGAARRRARAWIVVISAAFGALRLRDRIPPYRLDMCGPLPGLAHLPMVWRTPLDEVLPAAAGRGVIVDCRSAEYATAWRPSGALAERTVTVRIVRRGGDGRSAASFNVKHARGLVVRRIVTDAIDPRRPAGLAEALSAHFDVDLRPPPRAGQPSELHVVEPEV
jgi:uncharacterized protein